MPLFRHVENYEDEQGPKFEGHFSEAPATLAAPLRVVSYNIDKGKEVDQAVADLGQSPDLQGADIVLLQEMDESGVEQAARALGLNFVYYPASILHGKNFGNAILTQWSLRDPAKLILPRRSRFNGQIRTAVRADVDIAGKSVRVYSAHTEIYTASIRHRRLQAGKIVDDIPHEAAHVIVGGDFNTVSIRSIRRLTGQFAEAGLRRASKGSGPTVSKYATNPSAADHIFTWGFELVGRGREKAARASDHFPIWVTLNFGE